MSASRAGRALVAEAAGTAVLVCAVVGSGMMAERLAADRAVALIANTGATVAALYVLVTLLRPLSGAHLNPAVTLAALLRGETGAGRAASYVGAQVAGGVLGVVLTHAMFEAPLLQIGATARGGAGQWLGEFVATFGLVATIVIGARRRPEALPALVALFIGSAYWFTASTSFANPAVTVARSLTDSFAGIRPADAPAFVAAQLAGAAAAAAAAGWLAPDPGAGAG